MIIECVNCNKKFNVKDNLIPKEGRQIQCGSCDHIWFYKLKIPSSETFSITENNNKEKENIKEKNPESNIVKDQIIAPTKSSKIEKYNDNIKIVSQKKTKNNILSKFFSYLIVLVISFVALIILLDTFKVPLINIFPVFEIILFNLFETIKDIKLFIIDLT